MFNRHSAWRWAVLQMAAMLLSGAASAQTYQPAFQPETLKGPASGSPNDVLVLGTIHFSELDKTPAPAEIAPVIDRLAAWSPTAITTENVSGLQCDAMRRYPSRYADTVADYCPETKTAAQATGLDVPAANAEADRLLAAWPATPTSAQRRHLAAVFLAAGERHSALVQWLRIPAAERHAGDGLNATLVTELDTLKARRNESGLLGAALAARLGLERVWSIDDHTADTADDPDPAVHKAAGEALMKAWDNEATHARDADDKRLKAGLAAPDGWLALYRAMNAPGEALRIYRSDFGAALAEPSSQQFGRAYVGYWETRNLRMASNIRDVIARKPGTRLLAIVGSSHKAYLEAYLNQMHDVRLVDAEAVLR